MQFPTFPSFLCCFIEKCFCFKENRHSWTERNCKRGRSNSAVTRWWSRSFPWFPSTVFYQQGSCYGAQNYNSQPGSVITTKHCSVSLSSWLKEPGREIVNFCWALDAYATSDHQPVSHRAGRQMCYIHTLPERTGINLFTTIFVAWCQSNVRFAKFF